MLRRPHRRPPATRERLSDIRFQMRHRANVAIKPKYPPKCETLHLLWQDLPASYHAKHQESDQKSRNAVAKCNRVGLQITSPNGATQQSRKHDSSARFQYNGTCCFEWWNSHKNVSRDDTKRCMLPFELSLATSFTPPLPPHLVLHFYRRLRIQKLHNHFRVTTCGSEM